MFFSSLSKPVIQLDEKSFPRISTVTSAKDIQSYVTEWSKKPTESKCLRKFEVDPPIDAMVTHDSSVIDVDTDGYEGFYFIPVIFRSRFQQFAIMTPRNVEINI